MNKYFLIDFENVQKLVGLEDLIKENGFLKIFLGKNQTKLPIELVKSIQKLGDKVDLITISGNGPNALDFHIAYFIGVIMTKDNSSVCYIISKDKGFDPLIEKLSADKKICMRCDSVSDLKKSLVPKKESKHKKNIDTDYALEILRKATRPSTLKGLKSTIASLSKPQKLSDSEVDKIIADLKSRGSVTENSGKIVYKI